MTPASKSATPRTVIKNTSTTLATRALPRWSVKTRVRELLACIGRPLVTASWCDRRFERHRLVLGALGNLKPEPQRDRGGPVRHGRAEAGGVRPARARRRRQRDGASGQQVDPTDAASRQGA